MGKVALCFLPAILLGCAVQHPALVKLPPPPPYDYEATRANFNRIAKSLNMYRQHVGFKEPSQRKSYADAGLPPSMLDLTKPNKPWTVPESRFQVKLRFPIPGPRPKSDFGQLYEGKPSPSRSIRNGSPLWADRGEDLPILVDKNPFGRFGADLKAPIKVVILRLSGKVDEVIYRMNGDKKLVMEQ